VENIVDRKYDVVIIGAGIAGLYAAMQLPESKKVLVVFITIVKPLKYFRELHWRQHLS